MKFLVTKVCRGILDTTGERERVNKAFKDDPETRRRLLLLIEAVEKREWKKALSIIQNKWWSGHDKKQECSRREFIGLLDLEDPGNPRHPANGFDVFSSWSDLIYKMVNQNNPYAVTTVEPIVEPIVKPVKEKS